MLNETNTEKLRQLEEDTNKIEQANIFFEGAENFIEVDFLRPKIYINSFPKSGTHMANLICAHIAQKQKPKCWLGSFRGHSWTTEWTPLDNILPVIHGQPSGTWYQGHMGYKPEIEDAFYEEGVAMLFIYRDLRDVAVSQTYHIEMTDGETKFHPGKEEFMALSSHEERLKHVIVGLDEYSGIMERWEYYAPWLSRNWVLPVRYEDMLHKKQETAEKVIRYILSRTDRSFLCYEENVSMAMEMAQKSLGTTEYSSSYRKGVSGEWRKEFTEEHIKLFKEQDKNNWLMRLGYEESTDW